MHGSCCNCQQGGATAVLVPGRCVAPLQLSALAHRDSVVVEMGVCVISEYTLVKWPGDIEKRVEKKTKNKFTRRR